MTAVYEWVVRASVWWWPRFADHLWQTTLFALLILAAAFVIRRGAAHLRHTLCLLASAKFIIPAALFFFLVQQTGLDSLLFLRGTQIEQNATLLSGVSAPVATFASTYEVTVVATDAVSYKEVYFALSAIWLTGILAIFVLWTIRRRKFLNSLQAGQTVQDGREWQALESARETLHLRSEVGLLISPLKTEPAVWRAWRPLVVLPESIAGQLDDDELEAIMLHELVHIQRRDNLIGNLQLALCALLWFHPLVWFISRRLFNEREQATDERVMEVFRAPEAYASSILKVVRFCFGWRVAGVIGTASGSNLRRRIKNIMASGNTKRGASRASRVVAGTLLGVALLILVGAGIYSRPRTVAAAKETEEIRTGSGLEFKSGQPSFHNDDSLPSEPSTAIDRKSRKNKQQPPAPPAPAIVDATPTAPSAGSVGSPQQPPSPASPASPASPPSGPAPASPPTEPTAPPMKDKADKAQKDKGSKEKNKEKLIKGELIEAPKPVYPDEAKKQKIEGLVVVKIVIGDNGNVISAKANSGPEALYGAAETAASKARFKPSTLNGKPVKVAGAMTYNFVLDKE
jgi:TonB family protein